MYLTISPTEEGRRPKRCGGPRIGYQTTSIYLVVFTGLYAVAFITPFWAVDPVAPSVTVTTVSVLTFAGTAEENRTSPGAVAVPSDHVWRFGE